MSVEEKKHLLDLLNESHSAMRGTIEGVDMGMRIYIDTGWRIQDILAHIAVWDRQVAKSIRAYKDGGEYFIPEFDEDDFNKQAVSEVGEWSVQQVLTEWEQARQDFKAAVQEIPHEKFPGDLLYPWGDERGSIGKLVRYMCEHDEEHREDIVKALQAS